MDEEPADDFYYEDEEPMPEPRSYEPKKSLPDEVQDSLYKEEEPVEEFHYQQEQQEDDDFYDEDEELMNDFYYYGEEEEPVDDNRYEDEPAEDF